MLEEWFGPGVNLFTGGGSSGSGGQGGGGKGGGGGSESSGHTVSLWFSKEHQGKTSGKGEVDGYRRTSDSPKTEKIGHNPKGTSL